MIVTNEVSLKWSVTNAQHYKNRGYAFTLYNHRFLAKVEDLPSGSDIRVEIKCDRCGEHDIFEYRDVYRNKNSTVTLCRTCLPISKKGPMRDLTGMRFGSFEVKGLSQEVNYQGRYMWDAECECGTVRPVTGYMLEKGIVSHCGCNHKGKARPRKDLSGAIFYKIKVLSLSNDLTKDGKLLWDCRCRCKKRTLLQLTTGELTRGVVRNCGCMQRVPIDMKGKKFGHLKVIGIAEKKEGRVGVWWTCLCSCGSKVEIMTGNLRAGNRTSCGCRGKSIPNKTENRKTACK